MKKYLLICLICSLLLVGCSKTASPIRLPDLNNISSINISFEENKIHHTNKTWINDVILEIKNAKATRKESVQDEPKVEEYIKIDIKYSGNTSTLFAYENKKKYYIEQPYQGIYEIDDNLYQKLQQK